MECYGYCYHLSAELTLCAHTPPRPPWGLPHPVPRARGVVGGQVRGPQRARRARARVDERGGDPGPREERRRGGLGGQPAAVWDAGPGLPGRGREAGGGELLAERGGRLGWLV